MGELYVVATPIGNLDDLTSRAARVLGVAGLVVAEDTRVTRKLLAHQGLRVPLLRYDEHSAADCTPRVLQALRSMDVALVTDAGVPGLSDPGAKLVRAVVERGFRAVPVPGPSALTAALSVSGIRADAFRFLGFPPRARSRRLALLRSLAASTETLVLFEAPHRLRPTLVDMAETLGERRVAVCRELTKLHEEVFRGTAAEALEHFAAPRGEVVVVVEGLPGSLRKPNPRPEDKTEAQRALAAMKAEGMARREAVTRVTQAYGVGRRFAYRVWLEA